MHSAQDRRTLACRDSVRKNRGFFRYREGMTLRDRASMLATLGHRIRHFRTERGLTLDELGAQVGVAASQLSLIENGKREPRLSLLSALAAALGVQLADLLVGRAAGRARRPRDRARRGRSAAPLYASLGLPAVKPTQGHADRDARGARRAAPRAAAAARSEAIATPEEARRANTELRERMRARRTTTSPRSSSSPRSSVRASGHIRGALTHREVSVMAEQLGFELIYVNDLPHSARSVTDLENGRIYLPPASIPGGHGLRSMALQAMAHRLLGPPAPRELRRLPAAAARDQLLRRVLPDAARRRRRVPAAGEEGPRPRGRGLPRRVRRHPRGGRAAADQPGDAATST